MAISHAKGNGRVCDINPLFHISFSLQILNDCQRLLLAVVLWFWLLSKKILFQFFNKGLLTVKSLGGWFSVSSPGNLPLENIPSVSPHHTHTEKQKKRPIDKAGGCLQWSWTLWLSGLMFLCLESPYHPPFKQLKKIHFLSLGSYRNVVIVYAKADVLLWLLAPHSMTTLNVSF